MGNWSHHFLGGKVHSTNLFVSWHRDPDLYGLASFDPYFCGLSFFFLSCAGSLFLCRLFSSCGQWGLSSNWGVRSSHCGGFSCCRSWALGMQPSVVAACGFSRCAPRLLSTGSVVVVLLSSGISCLETCGIFLAQGSNLCLLHWQVNSLPLSHQGSPIVIFVHSFIFIIFLLSIFCHSLNLIQFIRFSNVSLCIPFNIPRLASKFTCLSLFILILLINACLYAHGRLQEHAICAFTWAPCSHGLMLGLMISCCHLEVFNKLGTRISVCSFLT